MALTYATLEAELDWLDATVTQTIEGYFGAKPGPFLMPLPSPFEASESDPYAALLRGAGLTETA